MSVPVRWFRFFPVNTNPPNEQTLTAQSELASAFYVRLNALDDGFSGY